MRYRTLGILLGLLLPVFAGATYIVPQGGTGSTTLTGILKGNGTGIVQTAVPNVDYALPGGSGASSTLLQDQNFFSASNTIAFFNSFRSTTTGATTTAFAIRGVPSAIMLTNGNGSVSGYTGTSCTNQFPRSISALGVATCASIANTDLVSSSITINGFSVSLGGSITVASTTLLGSDNNTFSGLTQFTGASTTLQNFTALKSTTTYSTSTNFFSNLGTFTNLYVTGSSTLSNLTSLSATTTNATTTALAIASIVSCSGANALTTTSAGAVICGAITGGTFPFTPTTNFGVTMSATSSSIFHTGTSGVFASGTSVFGATTTASSSFIIGTSSLTLALPSVSFFMGTSTPFFYANGNTRNVGIGTTTVMENNQAAMLTIDGTKSNTEELLRMVANVNDFVEANVQNLSSGLAAQSCYTMTHNLGTLTSGFLSLCQNNSGFNTKASYNVGSAYDSSLLSLAKDLYIANGTSTGKFFLMTGGVATNTNIRMTIDAIGNTAFGTSSPYAFLSLTPKYGSTTPVFDVATTTNSSGSATSSMFRVNADGRIGVGTSSPWGLFSISATSTKNPYLAIGSSTRIFEISPSGTTTFGIGTSSPYAMLSVHANTASLYSATLFTVSSSSPVATTSHFNVQASGAMFAPNTTTSGSAQTGYWCYDANGQFIRDTVACIVSARKFKKDIQPLGVGLNDLMKMDFVSYYKKVPLGFGDDGMQMGVIADDVAKINPALKEMLVTYDKNGEVHGFRYDQFTALIGKSIQDLFSQFQSLVARVSGLEQRLNDQQRQIDILTAKVNSL